MKDYKLALVICLVAICYVVSGRNARGKNICGEKVPCDDLECIDRHEWCDREVNCADGSDERYCERKSFWTTPDNRCDDRHFVCENKQCVPIVVRCDGHEDCWDYTDEDNCEESNTYESLTIVTEPDYSSEESTTVTQPIISTSIYSTPPTVVRSQRTTEASIDHYSIRRLETGNEQRRTVYEINRHQFDKGSDTVPALNFPSNVRTAAPDYGALSTASRTPVVSRHSPRTTRDSLDLQRWPEIHRPRAIIYLRPEYPGSSTDFKKKRRNVPLPRFHFEDRNAYLFRNNYDLNVRKAEQWLLSQRDVSYGWDEDTPRALVALSLVTNSFPSSSSENDIMRRNLRLDLGAKLIRNTKNPLSDNRLAMYINALLATCQDPRRILGQDLTEMLFNRTNDIRPRRTPASPFFFITQCLTNVFLTRHDMNFLHNIVNSAITDEVSKDRFILATSALACYHKWEEYKHELSAVIERAFRKLLQQELEDGSFGSIYSTTIAAQALIAIDSDRWDPRRTLDFIANKQSDDGSFGNMLATYYALPALSGRSLVHLRNTVCEPTDDDYELASSENEWSFPEPKKSVIYTLAVGPQQRHSVALHITVPVNFSFFDIMKFAEHSDPRFKFLYKDQFGKIDVYAVSSIPNDPERGMYWNLYVLDSKNSTVVTSQMYTGDIRTLIPEDSQELLFWYLPFKSIFPEETRNTRRRFNSRNNHRSFTEDYIY